MKTIFTIMTLVCSLTSSIAQSLPNNDFENWDTTGNYARLNDWTTSNESYVFIEGDGVKVEHTNDSYSGIFAASIGTAYMGFVGAATPCFIINGNFQYNDIFPTEADYMTAGTPINQKISELNGYYKYETNILDSARVFVFLKRYNVATSMTEMVGYGTAQLPPQASYTAFQVPVQDLMPGVMPDSIITVFQSFDFSTALSATQNSTLFVDAVSLVGTTDVQNISVPIAWIYPNPVSENLWIESAGMQDVEVRLLSVSGQEIKGMYYENFPSKYSLSIGELPKGSYVLEIKSEGELVFVEKVLVK